MIVVACRYCPKNFPIDTNDAFKLVAPTRDALRLTCPHCGCRMALDLNLRRKGKSAATKKAEAEEKRLDEQGGLAIFEQTERAGSGATWGSLTKWEQAGYISTARALRKRHSL